MTVKKRKFGKKNIIKIDPLAYNLGLIGESGIGKSSLAVEVCEKLAGEDGYMLANIGKEDGVDAIPNAIYEDIPDWETFEAFVEDITENRTTDYKDLRIVVIDTIDELFRIAEPEVIRLHNKANPTKKTTSIKAAFGGFMAGEDKAIEMILDKVWELKQVGVNFFIIGHTKRKNQNDVATGEEYETLTANLTNRYFNAIKTKLHVLGVASVNRSIEKTRIKQKIGDDKVVGKITGESRIITFRDDNFNIDSKSRFSEITPQINLDADEFIEAIKEAIVIAHNKQKNSKPIEEAKEEQAEAKVIADTESVKKVHSEKINLEENEELVEVIKVKFSGSTEEIKVAVKEVMAEFEFTTFADPTVLPTLALRKIVELLG